MSSLLFGVLLSALTIYLLHGASDCGQLALAAGASEAAAAAIGPSAASLVAGGGGGPPLHHHHHHQHLHSASLLPRELLRPAGEFGLEAGPHESVGAAGSPPVEPLELVGRQLARGDANETAPLVGAAMSPNQSSGNNNNSTAAAFQRLPAALAPEHYNLFIWPHIAEPSFHFNGSVEIQLKCRESTTNITLHTLELELLTHSIELLELPAGGGSSSNETRKQRRRRRASSGALKVARVSQDKQLQYSIIHLDGALVAGRDYLLRLDFVGALNDDLAGFYKIKYERQNSTETTWIAATQFQATDARRAFPCFDEPHYKATFSIKIRHWKNMTALSNMPIVRSENSSDGLWITDTFAKSHRMSTYLVAWTVTNFESRSDGNISVWTRPGFGHTAEYALKIAGRILRHYEQFFGIAYPLPKMDMIALPDFNAGAMENWGLVTYRETAMLFDENASTVANKQRVAVVVAHELAHQWFGNLVTPKWWDDLWLNEGFASFVEYIGVDHVEPKWRMLEQFVIEEVQNVFKVDGLSSSHQISIPVNNPDEISEIFDHISYAKGASIIRMMSHFLTERVFKLGLQRYLRALKYNNAEQSDLWAHLTEAQRQLQGAGSTVNSSSSERLVKRASNSTTTIVEPVNVERVMNSWTLQTGYPLVTLTRNYDDEAAAGQAGTLDQVRYQPYKLISANTHNSTAAAASALNGSQASRQQRWEIPITMTWKSEQRWQPVTRLWMRQNESEPTALSRALAGAKSDEWIVMNVQQVGYYRVNYDQRNWRLLIAQLAEDHTKILPTNRAQLLDDLFELAKSSLIDYRLAMEATKYLKSERDYLAWEAVLISFGYIDEMLQRTPIYGAWQDYFIQLIEPLYARYKHLEWTLPTGGQNNSNNASTPAAAQLEPTPDKNDVLESYNQNNAISWACKLNYEHCVKRARATFAQWRASGRNNIKPALRYPAYCTAIEHGTKEDWDFLWRVYEREQGVSERDRILRALGCSREIWVLSRYLDWTFTKSKPIRRQDGAYVFRMIAKNNYGRDIAFNFMRERWATIREYYGKTSFTLGHLIKSAATSMNTQVELDQLKAFFESIKSDVGTGKRSFQIAIEEVESNVFWRDRNYKILENWLQGQQPAAAAAAAA